MTCWQFGSHLDLERELLVGGQRLKRAADCLGNILKGVIGEIEDELASLDLRQIEYVVDQAEQVSAVTLKPFEYAHRLFWQFTVDAVRHQFGVAKNGVERRAKLVAHVGKKLRLVLARNFKLAALVLDFVEQADIFDGDHCLVGEGREQFDLPVCEWLYLRPRHGQHANGDSFTRKRHTEHGAISAPLLRFVQVYSGSFSASKI